MSLPLEGIRVVDAAQIFAGPGAAMYLADQGAEVIKLEPPGGEGCRYLYTSDKAPFGKSFLVLNRNKRSIVVDLEHAGGREVLHRLASWADVFISSLLPDAAQRLEADYKSLSRINPRLVYAAISAYGNNGTEAGKPGYDLVLQA
ncbi:CoA transferase, partial [Dehalococcoidia bacterium]|nr:CoA transferase [Dehalococcoidia bacterium]